MRTKICGQSISLKYFLNLKTKDGWQTSEYKTKTLDTPGSFQTETVSNVGLIDDQGREWEIDDVVLEKNQFGLVNFLN